MTMCLAQIEERPDRRAVDRLHERGIALRHAVGTFYDARAGTGPSVLRSTTLIAQCDMAYGLPAAAANRWCRAVPIITQPISNRPIPPTPRNSQSYIGT